MLLKARPIQCSTRYPQPHKSDATIVHKAGRAWHMIANQHGSSHFTMPKVRDIPSHLKRIASRLALLGDFDIKTLDIEGCFCWMPTEAIRAALWEMVSHKSTEKDVPGSGYHVRTRNRAYGTDRRAGNARGSRSLSLETLRS